MKDVFKVEREVEPNYASHDRTTDRLGFKVCEKGHVFVYLSSWRSIIEGDNTVSDITLTPDEVVQLAKFVNAAVKQHKEKK